jgi:hypothetical protein
MMYESFRLVGWLHVCGRDNVSYQREDTALSVAGKEGGGRASRC